MRAKILVTWRDNRKHFDFKLPTVRNDFCEITRTITLEADPTGVYEDGQWGYITANGNKVRVYHSDFDVKPEDATWQIWS